MIMRQKHMTHLLSRDLVDVGANGARLGRCAARVDQHGGVSSDDQSDGDIEERQPSPEHPVGQAIPMEIHCPTVSGCAARYRSSTTGVGSTLYVEVSLSNPISIRPT